MNKHNIIKRCIKLGMKNCEAEWIADNIYTYALPDWSEWSWGQIDRCLRELQEVRKIELCAS